MSQHGTQSQAQDSLMGDGSKGQPQSPGLIALKPIGADAPGCEGDSCAI